MEGPGSGLGGGPWLFRGQILDLFDGSAFHQRSPNSEVPADHRIMLSRRRWFLELEQEIAHESLGFSHLYGLTTVRRTSRGGLVHRGDRGEVLASGFRVSVGGKYRVVSWILDSRHRARLSREGVRVDRRLRYSPLQ